MIDEPDKANAAAPIDAKTFWRALGMRAVGVTVVTAQGADGPAGFLALSATHVTADPPSMLVSIDDRTQALAAVMASRHFAVNYLASSDQDLADSFGGRGPLKGASRFAAGRWRKLVTGAPVFAGALGAIDCELADTFRFHNTTIAVGRVAAFAMSNGLDPLVFFQGRYRPI